MEKSDGYGEDQKIGAARDSAPGLWIEDFKRYQMRVQKELDAKIEEFKRYQAQLDKWPEEKIEEKREERYCPILMHARISSNGLMPTEGSCLCWPGCAWYDQDTRYDDRNDICRCKLLKLLKESR